MVFKLEENFDLHSSVFPHFYFNRVANAEIQITEVKWFGGHAEQYQETRKIVDHQEWYEFYWLQDHYLVTLFSLDRTGWGSVIKRERAWAQETKISWGDERPPPSPMTQEEVREAFQDLMGIMQTEAEKQKLNSKRSA